MEKQMALEFDIPGIKWWVGMTKQMLEWGILSFTHWRRERKWNPLNIEWWWFCTFAYHFPPLPPKKKNHIWRNASDACSTEIWKKVFKFLRVDAKQKLNAFLYIFWWEKPNPFIIFLNNLSSLFSRRRLTTLIHVPYAKYSASSETIILEVLHKGLWCYLMAFMAVFFRNLIQPVWV